MKERDIANSLYDLSQKMVFIGYFIVKMEILLPSGKKEVDFIINMEILLRVEKLRLTLKLS